PSYLYTLSLHDALPILLVHHVLEKSIESSAAERVLTRADLISVTDNASRVSVPKAMLGMFADTSSGLLAQMLGGAGPGSPVAVRSEEHTSELQSRENLV